MDVSIFLSKALGLYLIFISILYIIRQKRLTDILMNMVNNPALMLVSGFIALIIGILLVVAHNIWVMDWRVLVTIAAWMTLTKGVSVILFPEWMASMSIKWIQNRFAYYATFLFVFVFGATLTYFGYIHST